MTVRCLTDSTSCLADGEAGIAVVSLEVLPGDGGAPLLDAVDITGGRLAGLLAAGAQYTTSRPSPQAFVERYERLIAAGATEIVSVHLSAALSKTIESALLAARRVSVPVHVIDTGTTGMGTGFAALYAQALVDAGVDVAGIESQLAEYCRETRVWVGVDSIDQLRRGGRLSAAQAMIATATRIKPLLTFANGEITLAERVWTTERIDERLLELALARVDELGGVAAVAFQHADAQPRAEALGAALLRRRPQCEVQIRDAGAVIAAHVGQGAIAAVVAPAYSAPVSTTG